jgi:hypothetical protein
MNHKAKNGKWQSLATAIMLQPVLYANKWSPKISYSLIFSSVEKEISIKKFNWTISPPNSPPIHKPLWPCR